MDKRVFESDLESKILNWIKENKLEGLGLFFMESILPFRRLVSHMIAVGEPFLSIFFNNLLLREFANIFYQEERYNKLYEELKISLEESKKNENKG